MAITGKKTKGNKWPDSEKDTLSSALYETTFTTVAERKDSSRAKYCNTKVIMTREKRKETDQVKSYFKRLYVEEQ